ncbi:hypothetical protein ACSL9C_000748 [Vibrio navarrensis]
MTTEHINVFKFDIDGLSDVSFEETEHCITKGQPYHGVVCTKPKEKQNVTIEIRAGRKKSHEVARWFMEQTHKQESLGGGIAHTYTDDYPRELNFAVRGNLTLTVFGIKYTAKDIILAQGSNPTSNDWWLGSANMLKVKAKDPSNQYIAELNEMIFGLLIAAVSESITKAVKSTLNGIYHLILPHKVGRGFIAFDNDQIENSKSLFFFRMEDSTAKTSLIGTYEVEE